FVLLVMLGAPLKLLLTESGIVAAENVGNVIEVEKVYEEGTFGAPLFNRIEELKRGITDVYTNYFPFYVGITTAANEFTAELNQPLTSFLMDRGNRILLESRAKPEMPAPAVPAPAVPDPAAAASAPEPETEAPAGSEPVQTASAPDAVEPEPAQAAPFRPEYNAVYLQGDNRHRYYEITAKTAEDAEPIDFFVRVPAEDSESLRGAMEEQLSKINGFAASDPSVHWYVFPATCLEDTALCDEILPSESKHGLFEEFRSRLDPAVQFDCVAIDTVEDKYDKYFRTDHHWNVRGYTEAYRKITAMMQKNYGDIELYEPEIRSYDGVEFYGSNALAVSSYKISDTFAVAVFPLEEHTVVREDHVGYGGTETLKQSLERYETGKYEKSSSYNHYIQFQMICREVEYPENKTGRNLLFIGDSYSPPLHEVLASYFDRTYIRYVDSNDGLSTEAYRELIEKYGITDVLLLEMSDRVIYDYYGDSLKGITAD
ncbi:MAG: hypothetical protein J6Q17_08595, partial [Clostridia bacterium]|nr:hypothetical protein [Clostridia bacterium]